MPTLIQGKVGPQILAEGSEAIIRLGRGAELIVSELHGKYYEQTFRGNVFVATQTAGIAINTQSGQATSFALANPAGSGKNCSLIRWDVVMTALPATPVVGVYGLYVNTNTIAAAVTGTAVTPFPGLLGTNYQPVAKPFSTATVPANPTLFRVLETKLTGAATTIPYLPQFFIDFDGTCILTPGTTICLQQIAADTTNGSAINSVVWEEVAP